MCVWGGGGGGGIEGSFPSANVYHLNVIVSGIKSLEDSQWLLPHSRLSSNSRVIAFRCMNNSNDYARPLPVEL